jgi:hypothetical protein
MSFQFPIAIFPLKEALSSEKMQALSLTLQKEQCDI